MLGTPAPGSGKPNEHLHLRVMMVRGIVLNSFFVFIFVNLVLRLRSRLRGLRTRHQAMQPSLSTVPEPSNLTLQFTSLEDLQYQLEKWLPVTTSSKESIATPFSPKEGNTSSLEHDGILRRMDQGQTRLLKLDLLLQECSKHLKCMARSLGQSWLHLFELHSRRAPSYFTFPPENRSGTRSRANGPGAIMPYVELQD